MSDRWKDEALMVLAEWQEVYVAAREAGMPRPQLGASIPLAVRDWLRDERHVDSLIDQEHT